LGAQKFRARICRICGALILFLTSSSFRVVEAMSVWLEDIISAVLVDNASHVVKGDEFAVDEFAVVEHTVLCALDRFVVGQVGVGLVMVFFSVSLKVMVMIFFSDGRLK
jgi:hypothetical protein